jgi:hypothetical protein
VFRQGRHDAVLQLLSYAVISRETTIPSSYVVIASPNTRRVFVLSSYVSVEISRFLNCRF